MCQNYQEEEDLKMRNEMVVEDLSEAGQLKKRNNKLFN